MARRPGVACNGLAEDERRRNEKPHPSKGSKYARTGSLAKERHSQQENRCPLPDGQVERIGRAIVSRAHASKAGKCAAHFRNRPVRPQSRAIPRRVDTTLSLMGRCV